jgi:hypothetical protein
LKIFEGLGWLLFGVASQKNGPVTSDIPRCAPQHRKYGERNRKINDLEEGGESFFRQPHIISTLKPTKKTVFRAVFDGADGGQTPLASNHI